MIENFNIIKKNSGYEVTTDETIPSTSVVLLTLCIETNNNEKEIINKYIAVFTKTLFTLITLISFLFILPQNTKYLLNYPASLAQ
ncbi:hypothetical protein ACLM5H_05555 [Fredinandcohnia humi]